MAQTLSSAERLPTVLYRTPHNSAVAHQSPLSSAATHGGGARTSSNSSFYPNTFASPSSPILSPVGLRTPVSSTLAKQATPYSSEVDRSGGGSLRGLHGVGVGGDHHSHHGMSTGHGQATRQQPLYGTGSAPPPPITSLRETDRRSTIGGSKLDPQGGKRSNPNGTSIDNTAANSAGPNPLLANEYAFNGGHGNSTSGNPASHGNALENNASNSNNHFRSRWVTVYGFQQSDRELILRELQECGDIVSCRHGGTEKANFMHIQFQSKGEAQKALSKNGKQISKNLMMGVAPISQKHCSILLQSQPGGGGSVLSQASCNPKQQALLGGNGGMHLDMTMAMPQPVNTFWSKVNEYIFGI